MKLTIEKADVKKTLRHLETVHAWLFRNNLLAGVSTLHDVTLTITVLLEERDVYRDRCRAATKQMDKMTLRLQALEARRKKANEA